MRKVIVFADGTLGFLSSEDHTFTKVDMKTGKPIDLIDAYEVPGYEDTEWEQFTLQHVRKLYKDMKRFSIRQLDVNKEKRLALGKEKK